MHNQILPNWQQLQLLLLQSQMQLQPSTQLQPITHIPLQPIQLQPIVPLRPCPTQLLPLQLWDKPNVLNVNHITNPENSKENEIAKPERTHTKTIKDTKTDITDCDWAEMENLESDWTEMESLDCSEIAKPERTHTKTIKDTKTDITHCDWAEMEDITNWDESDLCCIWESEECDSEKEEDFQLNLQRPVRVKLNLANVVLNESIIQNKVPVLSEKKCESINRPFFMNADEFEQFINKNTEKNGVYTYCAYEQLQNISLSSLHFEQLKAVLFHLISTGKSDDFISMHLLCIDDSLKTFAIDKLSQFAPLLCLKYAYEWRKIHDSKCKQIIQTIQSNENIEMNDKSD